MTPSETSVWSSQKTSDEIAEVETELNAKLGDKADKTELNKRREIRVDEIYDSNSYYRVDAKGYYARPLYFRVVSTNGGEEILSFGQSVTSERKVIGKSVNATFKYIPPTSNASNGTLFIKTNKVDTSLTIFYTQIYSVASIPTLRDSTAEEYATGTDFNVQELATMDKVVGGVAKYERNEYSTGAGSTSGIDIVTLPKGHKYIVVAHFQINKTITDVINMNGSVESNGVGVTVRYMPHNGGGADATLLIDATNENAVIRCHSHNPTSEDLYFQYTVQVMTLA